MRLLRGSAARVIAAVLLCGVLGLVTSVGVAWWIALAAKQTYAFVDGVRINTAPDGMPIYIDYLEFRDEYRPGFTCVALTQRGPGRQLIDARLAAQVPPALEAKVGTRKWQSGNRLYPPRDPVWPEWLPRPPTGDVQYQSWSGRASGWPLMCLTSRAAEPVDATGASLPRTVSGALRVRPATAYQRFSTPDPDIGTVPLLPIWRGLAINASLFAVAWALVLVAPIVAFFTARRARRIRRGLCPACDYDTRGATGPGCPECGAALPAGRA